MMRSVLQRGTTVRWLCVRLMCTGVGIHCAPYSLEDKVFPVLPSSSFPCTLIALPRLLVLQDLLNGSRKCECERVAGALSSVLREPSIKPTHG